MARDILKLIYQDAYNKAQTSARTFNHLFYTEGDRRRDTESARTKPEGFQAVYANRRACPYA